ncbi:MAG: M20/M25/M40 family metallo-hydrolase [Proteobacteria bacterium]|nr:M20/M25/M40 family metallo-hydrolase [Pseudomonadota bacterium]
MHRILRAVTPAAVLAAVLAPALLAAQIAVVQPDHPAVKRALDGIKASNAWMLTQQMQLCEIPSPPFKERLRAEEFRKRMVALGYPQARIDSVGNVVTEIAGAGRGPTVVLAGHLDTVFPEGTDVKVKREGDHFAGPGIGDDCRGLSVVLAVAKAMKDGDVHTNGKVILVANVGEEGPGNLRGVRYLFNSSHKGKIDYFMSVDGLGLRVTSRAVGSKRYSVKFTGPGGHSYGAFGMPSAIHAMGRAIANISDLQVPPGPKTTFNVGIVKGGTSVNTISPDGTMDVDMRSENVDNLEKMDALIKDAIARGLAAENARWPRSPAKIAVHYDTIGIRPVGKVPQTEDTPIVRAAADLVKALGETPSAPDASSTDSNIPMSLGIPAITIGGGARGGNAHALSEWFEDTPTGYKGPQWALLLVASLAGVGRTVTP